MAEATPLRVLIGGASGLVGTELQRQLRAEGHEVRTLVRRAPRTETEFSWSPDARVIDAAIFDTVDVVVNLSGASIARIPWTRGYQKQIVDSRVNATRTLAEGMARASTPPRAFLSGSAVGFYGDRPAVRLTESADKGEGFLSDVVAAWEAAAGLAPESTRTVLLRTGLVVGDGGAMTPLRLLTSLGVAARIGSGGQHWPWISLYDEAAAIRHLMTSTLRGPVNLAGPTPATADRFTRALARAMHRWHLLAIPEPVIGTLMGDAGRELLLASQKQIPAALLADGFRFRHETVEDAIDALVSPSTDHGPTAGQEPPADQQSSRDQPARGE